MGVTLGQGGFVNCYASFRDVTHCFGQPELVHAQQSDRPRVSGPPARPHPLRKGTQKMSSATWLHAVAAACAAVFVSSAAVAAPVMVDFESVADAPGNFGLGALYFAGDAFTQRGFRMTVDFDFGTVGPGTTPSGNASAFYTQSNQGGLLFTRDDPEFFSLRSFDAGAVQQPSTSSTLVSYVAAISVDANFDFNNPVDVQFWALPSTGFATFTPVGPGFDKVYGIEFVGCLGTSAGPALCSRSDNLQFALDNVSFDVPEPGALSISLLALAGVAVSRRRKAA